MTRATTEGDEPPNMITQELSANFNSICVHQVRAALRYLKAPALVEAIMDTYSKLQELSALSRACDSAWISRKHGLL